MEDITVHPNGVKKQLTKLNAHKATGPDCIPTAILREAADELAPVVSKLYQHSLNTGTVPKDWRDALIVPVFKKGEKHQPSNYRPVSLTSVVCKVLEHVVYSSVMRFYDQHHILTEAQHGFRARRSCESQLLWTIQTIAGRLQGKGQVDIILLDFAKAFDKVPYQRLLHKLHYYGVRGKTLSWIQAFLTRHRPETTGPHRRREINTSGCPLRSSSRDGARTTPFSHLHKRPSRLCDPLRDPAICRRQHPLPIHWESTRL